MSPSYLAMDAVGSFALLVRSAGKRGSYIDMLKRKRERERERAKEGKEERDRDRERENYR